MRAKHQSLARHEATDRCRSRIAAGRTGGYLRSMTCFPTGSRSAVPTPDIHGGDAAAVARALGLDPASMLDLSASLNPFAPDVSALAGAHLDSLVAYPDDRPATRLLAMSLGVDPGRLVLTNGGAEAIALVAGHLGRGEVVEPEFSLYRRHLSVVEEGAGRGEVVGVLEQGVGGESERNNRKKTLGTGKSKRWIAVLSKINLFYWFHRFIQISIKSVKVVLQMIPPRNFRFAQNERLEEPDGKKD